MKESLRPPLVFLRLHLDSGAMHQEWQERWVKWEKQTGMDIMG